MNGSHITFDTFAKSELGESEFDAVYAVRVLECSNNIILFFGKKVLATSRPPVYVVIDDEKEKLANDPDSS